jgi:hypothetical protein
MSNEPHLVADLELGEALVEDAALVEVDFEPVLGLDEAVAILREDADDPAVRLCLVRARAVVAQARVVFELAHRRFERVAQGAVPASLGLIAASFALVLILHPLVALAGFLLGVRPSAR